MNFRKLIFIVLMAFAVCTAHAQPLQNYQFIGNNFVQSKNYYLLTLLQNYKPASRLINSDAALNKLTQSKLLKIQNTLSACKDITCFTNELKFSTGEIKTISNRLIALYKNDNALGLMVKIHLIPSGAYIQYNKDLSPVQMLVKAWEQDAGAVNYTIEVYAEGKKPNYPLPDSISFNVRDASYIKVINDGTAAIAADKGNASLFFLPSLNYALYCLKVNGRNDPANDEPMRLKDNKAAYQHIKTINWNKYKYSLILVPGAGPDKPGVALSWSGKARCRVAVEKYNEGLAPFLMVSGGKVHPYKTPYCEADEMKKFMIDSLHVPENVILVDPHARHTTTNLRNCVRIIFRYGMPFDKPFVTSTDASQSSYITGMAARCVQDLHYVPYVLGKRLSPTELECFPVIESLQINPAEPLDP